ncbi:Vacuolar protein sorting-associated protein 35 [Dinochytrium kinnereticum]|nr:Vacuolar protein sorting-associated protein 35 [Dinochytrium kinnereticum]
MSTSSIAPSGISTPNAEDQSKVLEEALNIVKVQAFHMKRCLDNGKLMDALKHCSTMLAELRTSSLTPKNYYELYMAIFDELRHLTTFLHEAHMSKRHHLSDLYELVQYAGNIVPRLYLMITVGSVYMRVAREQIAERRQRAEAAAAAPPKAGGEAPAEEEDEEEVPPIRELMKDMLEMARGVQHPTRGPHGTINDSIQFILQNFIEMNKLWVRLQFQGHSREREKREKERKELRLLVGSNLVRLSQLDGLDLEIFRGYVLPKILEEIVSCKDIIAQEYLMEVIIQVFQDDFHLRTLDSFLSATAKLHRNVNVKQTVISLIDRFAAFAARARDEADAKAKVAAANGETGQAISGIPDDVPLFEVFWGQITELIQARPEFSIQDVIALLVSLMNLSLNCYPDRLDHADQILGFAKEKVLEALSQKSTELHIPQTTSSLLQLLLAPISAYRSNPLVLLSFPSSSTQHPSPTESQPADDAVGWAAQYAGPPQPKIIAPTPQSLFGNYTDLLFLQPFATRRQVGHAFASACVRASAAGTFGITTVEEVDAVLGEVCGVMIRDQKDGGLFGSRRTGGEEAFRKSEETPLDWEDVVEEQNLVAKLVHLVKSKEKDPEDEFLLLAATRKHFGEGGDIRIRFTLPPLVMASIQLANKYLVTGSADDEQTKTRLVSLYKFIHQTVLSLSRAQEHFSEDDYETVPMFKGESSGSIIGRGLLSPPDIAIRLFLMSAKSADETGHEELSYEFFVQALTLYEESISESRAQTAAITLIIGTLYNTTIFGFENYETLITKCTVHCSRLLKRVDQCRGVTLASHLFWAGVGQVVEGVTDEEAVRKLRDKGRVVYRDGKKVLECLQKALKVADSVMDQSVNVELFVEILEKYVWYFERRNDAITVKYLNSLIDLIQTNLANIDSGSAPSSMSYNSQQGNGFGRPSLFGQSDGQQATSGAGGRRVPDSVVRHFGNLLAHLRFKQDEEAGKELPGFSTGFGGSVGRWGEIDFGRR